MSTDSTAPEVGTGKSPSEATASHQSTNGLESTAKPLQEMPAHDIVVYSRRQLLRLYKSPHVRVPDGMPKFKDWFGEWNEQATSRKETADGLGSTASPRDRRFRRDADDAESGSRNYRSTLTQPSQMGSFRHQSLRSGERDKDRDAEKDRERERDKEGHERLRNLSDKYDRDRLGLPGSSTLPRNRDRDTAPHLTTPSSGGSSSLLPTSRRGDTRDSTKKKAGEANEDWRRGAEPRRGRDDPADSYRRDRDDRDRPRSRIREASRPRRDTSSARRDRDRGDHDERDRDRRPDRKNDRDDRPPRGDHWVDDGRWEERMDGRRRDRERDRDDDRQRDKDRNGWREVGEKEHKERPTDKKLRGDRDKDRARSPQVADEKHDRSRRNGREKKEDGKDKDDRKEREKEPAWMETYIPSDSNPGIFGGQSSDGHLDSIQAWKKGMQAKVRTDKLANEDHAAEEHDTSAIIPPSNGLQLDEIQLFKMMMEREGQKRSSGGEISAGLDSSKPTTQSVVDPAIVSGSSSRAGAETSSNVTETTSRNVLSLLVDGSNGGTSSFVKDTPALPPDPPITSANLSEVGTSAGSTSFVPPQTSRLLAFGARNAKDSSQLDSGPNTLQPTPMVVRQPSMQMGNLPPAERDGVVSPSKHSPILDPSPPPRALTPIRKTTPHTEMSQGRVGVSRNGHDDAGPMELLQTLGERPGANMPLTPSTFLNTGFPSPTDGGLLPGLSYAPSKGSRFAKFFDAKGRDGSMSNHPPPNAPSPTPGMSRQSSNHLNHPDVGGGNSTGRSMDDIVAMLTNSVQSQRVNELNQFANSGGSYSQAQIHAATLQNLQLQQQYQRVQGTRLDSVHDNRFDGGRAFSPDNMVPGLRTGTARSRDANVMFSEMSLDDIHYTQQRMSGPPPQHRPEQMGHLGNNSQPYGSSTSGFGRGLGIQQHMGNYRGNPSPIGGQNPLLGMATQQQRLPPGLANLGIRPPHDPSQYVGASMRTGLSMQQQQQPLYTNFSSQPTRAGPGPGPPHQVQSPYPHSNADMRLQGQSQVHALNHVNAAMLGGGPARNVPAFNGAPQPAPGPHMQAHIGGPRQQNQHVMSGPGMHPMVQHQHHAQQHGTFANLGGGHSPQNQDLMALLMGGIHRE